MATRDLYSANKFYRLTFGDYGFRYLDSGGTNTSPEGEIYGLIESLGNTTLSFTNLTEGGDTTVTDLTLKDFHSIRGNITNITVTAGQCVAYLRK